MAAGHSPAFLKLVNEAKSRIRQVHARDMPKVLADNPDAHLVDVREESEFAAGRIEGAVWLGKGVIERDVEGKFPNKDASLYLYCGGGFRSALAADNLQLMGYRNVYSVDGGWRVLKDVLQVGS
ncbi:MAG TPA: rhodanese-like domain-containing protein [Solimonas sp.]|nr:rhodanese-like domain-containing protein [Solimonas sp.]